MLTIFKIIIASSILSYAAPILLDFDMTGRPLAEGNEPGYTQWAVESTTSSASKTVDGITITISRNGGSGTGIRSYYYKAGVQAPHYARLICDALSVVDGDAGASIRVSISGLSAGIHTLQAYHNTIDGKQHSNIKVVVNDTTRLASIPQTNQKLLISDASSSYVSFTATTGKTVTIDYISLQSSTYNNVFIDNLSLDVSDPTMQASDPYPENRDMHANADNGTITLTWKSATAAKSHQVYFGTDSVAVYSASTSSPEYMGSTTNPSYTISTINVHHIYYWRVDEVNSNGVASKGTLWKMAPRRLAFPGAEGYGRFARGGRGGKVVHVSNLNDAGAGSLREAVESDIGPRTIVFDVGGVITLNSRLTLSSSNVTIAGQTAPGKGIVIRSAPFGFSGVNDGIMRFIKVRLGYGATFDGTGLQGSNHSIFDHLSISWTIDEAFSSRSGKNITLQRSMISECLNVADHQNYPSGTAHGYAATIGGDVGSFHHNLLAHCEGRNWSLGGGLDGNGYYAGRLDIFNNLVYNWRGRATDGGAHEVNFVNNYYKEGAATTQQTILNAQIEGTGKGSQSYYYSGNIHKSKTGSFTCDGTNNTCGRNYTLSGGQILDWTVWATQPFFPSYATIQTAQEAYKSVLSDVGMTLPMLDDHDRRIITETRNGTYTYSGSQSGYPGLPDRESDVGGYESYPTTYRPAGFDTDGDGMPDWWEKAHGYNSNSGTGNFSETNEDADGNGYTNLEEYLNWLANPHATVNIQSQASFALADLTQGYLSSPQYTVASSSCATTSMSGSTLTVTSNQSCPIFSLQFTVTDSDGSTFTKTLALHDSTAPVGGNINLPPAFSNLDTFYVAENTTDVGTILAKDPEGFPVTYALTTSSDMGLFQINAQSGKLSFVVPPDFENPLDNGANNIHHLMITASDGIQVSTRKHIVIVTDVIETPTSIKKSSTTSHMKSKVSYDLLGRAQ